jgi:hypothetical protein
MFIGGKDIGAAMRDAVNQNVQQSSAGWSAKSRRWRYGNKSGLPLLHI